MAEKGKGKSRGEITQRRRRDGGDVRNKKRKNLSSGGKHKEEKGGDKKRRSGPRLPNALKKELERLNPTVDAEASDGDEEIDSDGAVGNDVYEYEEGVAEEESMKNKRYDPVENYEFELPEDFEVSLSLSMHEKDKRMKICTMLKLLLFIYRIGRWHLMQKRKMMMMMMRMRIQEDMLECWRRLLDSLPMLLEVFFSRAVLLG